MVKARLTNAQVAALLAAKILAQVRAGASKGLEAASKFMVARLKEELSVPAPRAAIRDAPLPGQKKGGILGYRAKTKATPGAPPRKLSGRLRASITSRMISKTRAAIGTNVIYARPLEMRMNHKFMEPVFNRFKTELAAIVGKNVKAEFKK